MTMNTEEFTTTGEGGADRIKEAAGGVASEAGRAAESRASQTMSPRSCNGHTPGSRSPVSTRRRWVSSARKKTR